jgi:LPS-assembly protein
MIQHRYLDERQFVFNAAWLLLCVFGVALPAGAQIPPPDPRYLFREDEKEFQRYQKAIVERAITADSPRSESLDFQAPEVEYRKESNEIVGSGGVVISKGGIQAQAQKARANTETEDLALIDNVLVAAPDASIGAERGKFNLNTETGSFENARFVYENGNYGITAEELSKVDEFSYQLFRPVLSTCHCADGKLPWSIRCGRATVTQEGYAHTYSTTLNIYDVPILYSPWFAFPVKEERQTGLLVPLFGYSSEDGFGYTQPFYYVVDPNSDATLTPFIETETRLGTSLDFRRAFSRSHDLQTRVYFSDESARDGDLRGTVVDNLFDPTFDDNRFGGFYRQRWMPAPGGLPVSAIADINYVSDDLFLREIDAEDIARPNSRYVTSTALLRGSAGGMLSAEVGGEYNQSMETDDDVIFQRLPMATAMLTKSFLPFGYNP